MATWLKQSTAMEIKLGPFVDQTDGFTAETGLTIAQADVRLAKNAGDWAQKNESTTMVHEENGWYRCLLDTTDTNTLGILIVAVNESGALPVWREFLVVPANVYDSVLSTDLLQVDLTQIDGQATSGNNATLNLKQLNIVNSAGSALVASSTGSNGNGIEASGHGFGSGLRAIGGASGNGIEAEGGASGGKGVEVYGPAGIGVNISSDTGTGLSVQAGGNEHGVVCAGSGSGSGMVVLGGDTGHGIFATGGETSGDGLRATATSGDGFAATGGTNGHGITAVKAGSGVDIRGELGGLSVTTYAEPGQGTPAATATLANKINYLFKAWRNRTTQTSSQYSLYADDASTIDQKATASDDGTTFDRGEVATGP